MEENIENKEQDDKLDFKFGITIVLDNNDDICIDILHDGESTLARFADVLKAIKYTTLIEDCLVADNTISDEKKRDILVESLDFSNLMIEELQAAQDDGEDPVMSPLERGWGDER